MKPRILVVDGDLLLYKFAARNETAYKWEEEVTSIVVEEEKALKDVDTFFEELQDKLKAKKMIVSLSCSRCFRYTLMPSYKHNRSGKPKPLLYQRLKRHLLEEYQGKIVEPLEADDQLGIFGTFSRKTEYVMCTIDKDLKQIPGAHFNWDKDTEVRHVDELEANLWFYQQVIQGDSTDGFSGCPGAGPKAAQKALNGLTNERDMWEACMELYRKKGLDEAFAITMARMARILRSYEWSPNGGGVKLWTPPPRV